MMTEHNAARDHSNRFLRLLVALACAALVATLLAPSAAMAGPNGKGGKGGGGGGDGGGGGGGGGDPTSFDVVVDAPTLANGQSGTATVQLLPGDSYVAALDYEVTYNRRGYDVTGCSNPSGACNIATDGSVLFSSTQAMGWSQDSQLATIDVTRTSSRSNTAGMEVLVSGAANVAAELLIAPPPGDCAGISDDAYFCRGDANCDGTRDLLDALAISQKRVGLVADVGLCELAGPNIGVVLARGDMTGDGIVDLLDALTISQCRVGIQEGDICRPVQLVLDLGAVGSPYTVRSDFSAGNAAGSTQDEFSGATHQPAADGPGRLLTVDDDGGGFVLSWSLGADGNPTGTPMVFDLAIGALEGVSWMFDDWFAVVHEGAGTQTMSIVNLNHATGAVTNGPLGLPLPFNDVYGGSGNQGVEGVAFVPGSMAPVPPGSSITSALLNGAEFLVVKERPASVYRLTWNSATSSFGGSSTTLDWLVDETIDPIENQPDVSGVAIAPCSVPVVLILSHERSRLDMVGLDAIPTSGSASIAVPSSSTDIGPSNLAQAEGVAVSADHIWIMAELKDDDTGGTWQSYGRFDHACEMT